MRAAMQKENWIHPTAIVDPEATLGAGVQVGPFSIISAGAEIGADCEIGSHVSIESSVRMGKRNKIFQGAVVGSPPQDLKFQGEHSELIIGDDNLIREYATLNPGTGAGEPTRVGNGCLLMAYTHVAHNCEIGDGVILSNCVNLAGHIIVEDYAILGGVTPVHQFVHIGTHAFIGGGSRVPQDVPPFMRGAGSPLVMSGINLVGLKRRGFSEPVLKDLQRAYRFLYREGLNTTQALERIKNELAPCDEISKLIAFIDNSERGITK